MFLHAWMRSVASIRIVVNGNYEIAGAGVDVHKRHGE